MKANKFVSIDFLFRLRLKIFYESWSAWIVHKSCIILNFYTSCHIKENCVEFFFFFFFLFCSLVRNENGKRPVFYTLQITRVFPNFLQLKQLNKSKEYLWILWSSWIVVCLSWRSEILIRNPIVIMFLSVLCDYFFEYCSS